MAIETKYTAAELADQAVGLFLEALRRRGHDIEQGVEDETTDTFWDGVPAYDLEQARGEAVVEVAQGVAAEAELAGPGGPGFPYLIDAGGDETPEPDDEEEDDRFPYVGEGADGCRRSAQIDEEEAHTLDREDPRHAERLASAERWRRQAARHEMAPACGSCSGSGREQ